MTESTRYWVCRACPLAAECSEKSFRKWRCWGYTLDLCKQRVMQHLAGSGLHSGDSSEDRTDTYQCAVEEAEYVEEREAASVGGQRGTKRAHPSSCLGACPEERPDVFIERSASGGGRGRGSRDAAEEAVPIQQLERRMVLRESDDAVLPAPRRAATNTVCMSVTELKAITDALHRASKSAAVLGRVFEAAVRTCRDETVIFDEAREALRARIESAGYEWSPAS